MNNEVIYIPEYVEQGIAKLQQAKNLLVQIEAAINSGISTINASGYNKGIPHIEKGTNESSEISSLETTIDTITSEVQRYSNGEALELENAIIIADPTTIEKYGLKKEDIDYTLSEYILKSDNVASNPTIQAKWESGYLTGGAGTIVYTGADGRLTKETWCDLNPNNLAKLMREKHGIELDYWIREDGVYMYGDYVMVAADIPHMDGTEQEAEYRKGDLVQTSLGTGMVVDLCGMAELTRKGKTNVDVWYDIYTDWHGGYSHVGYCTDAGCKNSSHTNPQSKMIRKAENPTTINPRTGQPISSGFVFKSNTSNQTNSTTTQNTTQSNNTFVSNTNKQPIDEEEKSPYTGSITNTYGGNSSVNIQNGNSSTNTFKKTTNTGNSNSYVTNTGNSNSYTTYTPSYGNNSNYNTNTSSGSISSKPSASQVTNLYDVNGFSKPVSNSTPQVNTPVINSPISTPVISTPQPETNNVPSSPNTSNQVMIPEVGENNTNDIIDTTPIAPIVPETDNTSEIIANETPTIEKVPLTQPSENTETENSNNNGALVATLATAGIVGAGIGAKLYYDKRKENQNNEEDEDNSFEE